MTDELARELIAAVQAQTAAFQTRWASQDAALLGSKQAAETEELNLLRPMVTALQAQVDRLRQDRREARAEVEQLTEQLTAAPADERTL